MEVLFNKEKTMSLFTKLKEGYKKLGRVLESFYPWNPYNYTTSSSNLVLDFEPGWIELRREAKQLQVTELTIRDIRKVSQYLYLTNSNYIGLIRNYIKYIAGKHYEIISQNEKENENWKIWTKKIRWKQYYKEIIRRFFRDGEVFIYVPNWQFINPEMVQNPGSVPYGIELDEEGKPRNYYVLINSTFSKISSEDIIHIKMTDSDELRGMPYLFSLFSKIQSFEKWLDDRILLNRIRASIAILRKHKKTSPTNVKNFAQAKQENTYTDKSSKTWQTFSFQPGMIIDSTNVDYEFLEPKVQAKDVATDGRNIRLQFSAMTGLPEFMVSGDASNSNYASTMVAEGPGIREFEDFIDFFKDIIAFDIWSNVQKEFGIQTPSEPSITVPSLVSRDHEKETKINQILFEAGVISLEEWRRREGLDGDKMEQEINGVEGY